jgi:hypothetical protein
MLITIKTKYDGSKLHQEIHLVFHFAEISFRQINFESLYSILLPMVDKYEAISSCFIVQWLEKRGYNQKLVQTYEQSVVSKTLKNDLGLSN